MRWVLRHTIFALCFSLGSTAWFILAQKGAAPAAAPTRPAPPRVAETPVTQMTAQSEVEEPEVVYGRTVKFGPIEPISGYFNTQTVTLRESAEANAPVIARVEAGDHDKLVILGATRDFLRVRLAATHNAADAAATEGGAEKEVEYEGWASWDAFVPELAAIVLDAETGAVVARVPLGEAHSSVIFSPDGSRAIFTSEHNGGRTAYEVRTSDYTLTRSLTSSDNESFSALFYAPTGGDVYARVYAQGEKLVRISDSDAPNTPTIIDPNIIVSRDGLTGLMLRREESDDAQSLTVDVLDTKTLFVRNTFKVTGHNLAEDGTGFILNRDGSRLYIRLWENTGPISVIDTLTGQILRELPDSATESWSYFWRDSIVGDSVLLRVVDEGAEEMHDAPAKYWISNGKRKLAQPGVDHAIEAGGKRYAVNEDGTLFFQLDDNNRIQKRFRISRPERRTGADMGNTLSVFGLSASPDSKHIIMFVGMSHGC